MCCLPHYSTAVLTGGVPSWLSGMLFLALALSVVWLTAELVLWFVGTQAKRMKVRLALTAFCLLAVGGEVFFRCGLNRYGTWRENNGRIYQSGWSSPPSERRWFHLARESTTWIQTKPEFSFEIKSSSEGICDVEYDLEKRPSEFRIVVLGDSFA